VAASKGSPSYHKNAERMSIQKRGRLQDLLQKEENKDNTLQRETSALHRDIHELEQRRQEAEAKYSMLTSIRGKLQLRPSSAISTQSRHSFVHGAQRTPQVGSAASGAASRSSGTAVSRGRSAGCRQNVHPEAASEAVKARLGYTPTWFTQNEMKPPYTARSVCLSPAGGKVAKVEPDPEVRRRRMMEQAEPQAPDGHIETKVLNNLWMEDPKFMSSNWRPMFRLDGGGSTFTNTKDLAYDHSIGHGLHVAPGRG